MLNCFNIYAIVWTIIIFLYDLRWSDYCEPLNIHLRIFIYVSVIICLFLGQVTKDRFKCIRFNHRFRIGNGGTILICILQLFEYIYCREIPLLNVIFNGGNYSDFGGIPTFHVLIYTFSAFYAQVLFYAFINERKFQFIRNYIIIIFVVFVLQFMRGGLTICISVSALMYLFSLRKRMDLKKIIGLLFSFFIGIYAFGGIGNIRHGNSWNDSSAFYSFGRINSNFPIWLPKQFVWPYTYIVGSLATLNYNVNLNNTEHNFFGYIQSIIPDFISKRLWPNSETATPQLMTRTFTTTTGYFDSFYFGGIVGIYIMFFILVIVALFVLYANFIRDKYRLIVLSNLSIVFALYFFTNGLHNSAVSFSIVYPIVFSLISKKIKCPKYKFVYR